MRILFYYICIFNVGKSVANSGSADVCADGQSSETGMAPGCSDNYPHVVLTPKVVTDLADGIQIRKFTTLEPVFKCVFDEMIDSLKLVFDIHWYINNDLVVVNMNIAQGKLFDTHMRPHHWTTTYSMNMQVKCSVRARLGPNETPSPFFESEEITAGVISDLHLNSFVEVTEGKAATIKLRSTVPVGCFSKNLQSQCNHTMHIRQISYNYNSNRCINNLQTGDLAIETEFCGITIPSIGWDNTLDLKVTGYVNNLYDEQKTRTATIHFTSLVRNNVDISGTWNRVDIPDLKVRITDADHKLSGRACLAFTLSNFVHILQTAIKSSSTGICGIAVRSVNSIFVLRTCNTISQYFSNQNVLTVPVVQYKQCNDNDMTIQETGSGYKINLPSGTEITFQYERYWIKSILVKPSVIDDGRVDGLCGEHR
ncbi:unnamed protein product [Mytilus edulis]|uniref:Uncharacterized protein n=1 Tax=Mytilus edulis TaxID=6550 RepID=A0A8S3QAE4_MYTED|nr:unnamed protein product [Mytilus edulis]